MGRAQQQAANRGASGRPDREIENHQSLSLGEGKKGKEVARVGEGFQEERK
jgi:hypothetical protein